MTKEKIFDYLRHTPLNTNFSILGNMLDELTGDSGSIDDDVLFIDYDGTILYSYSLSEIQTLSALPKLPSHSGLICQGWNWTLDEIKARNCPLIVGAVYVTDDGATRIRIKIEEDGPNDIIVHFHQSTGLGVTIDWGDGSVPQMITNSGWLNEQHKYASAGEFIISLLPKDNCNLLIGDYDNKIGLINSSQYQASSNMVKEINLGKNLVTVDAYTCANFRNLETITIPKYVTTISDSVFNCCYALKAVVIPRNTTFIGSSCFNKCINLSLVSLPAALETINDHSFSYCYSLTRLTIPNTENISEYMCRSDYFMVHIYLPDNLTQIHGYSFDNCYSLKEINIPSLVNSIGECAFSNCESLTEIDISNCTNFQTFGEEAFSGCSALLRVTLANNAEIPAWAFSGCSGVKYYDFTACSAVPTLSNINAFEEISYGCKILVPASLHDTWIAATNWSTLASHIVAV